MNRSEQVLYFSVSILQNELIFWLII